MTSSPPQHHRPIIKSRAPATEPTASALKTSHLKRQKEHIDLQQTPVNSGVVTSSSPEHKTKTVEAKNVTEQRPVEIKTGSKPKLQPSQKDSQRFDAPPHSQHSARVLPSAQAQKPSFEDLRETVFKPPPQPQVKAKLSTDASQPISAHETGNSPVYKQSKSAINTSPGSTSVPVKDQQKPRRSKRTVTSLRICRDLIKTLTSRHKGSKREI